MLALATVIVLHAAVIVALLMQAKLRPSLVANGMSFHEIDVSLQSRSVSSQGGSQQSVPAPAPRATSRTGDVRSSHSVSQAPSNAAAIAPSPGAWQQAGASPEPPSSSTQSDYGRELLGYIERNKHYPDAGGDERPAGVVRVLFTVTRNGSVSGVWIRVSSGSVLLDREAVATLLRSQPLPPIPSNLPDTLNFSFDLEFSPPAVTISQ